MTLIGVEVRDVSDLTPAFATIAAKGANAILLSADPLFTFTDDIRARVIAWATGRRLPVVSPSYRVAPDGALFSLSTDLQAPAHRAAFYVHRILKGAKPADLPVELPMTFKLVVNHKTAAVLGLTIPQSVLLRADEVIR